MRIVSSGAICPGAVESMMVKLEQLTIAADAISPLSAVEAGAHVSRDWDLIHPGSAHAMVELVHVRLLVERAKRARENARDLLPGTSPCYLP